MNLVFAAISPHPPILCPNVGSEDDRKKLKDTLAALKSLEKKFKSVKPDLIIISSPHADWGFNVPLYFLARDFKGEIVYYLTNSEEPAFYFREGKRIYQETGNTQRVTNKKIAFIASGDMSHYLTEEGPYGFHEDGPNFDKALIDYLKKKDIENFLKLEQRFPGAGQCGLRSFSFLLGALEAYSESSGKVWEPEVLSYQGPFGVGYLVANFKL